jgi:hypothetical protein
MELIFLIVGILILGFVSVDFIAYAIRRIRDAWKGK